VTDRATPQLAGEGRSLDWEGFFRAFREPDFIPGYEILNKLGGGVFGDVYKARKTSIGKFYAIKFLKVLDEETRDDVLRELKSVDAFAQVDHPHLVSIEDKGEVKGVPYIVMSYAGDETLKTRLSQGPMAPATAFPVFRQVLQGVAALHERSIIHFDLKPANVFLRGDVARVGDYGLSKLVTQSARTLSMGRGTPAYMAPEMLQRKGDARSDVYSLGALLFEILAGRAPFHGDSEWEVLKKHESEPVVFPPAIPGSARPFIGRALDKDPAQRFRDAGEMLQAFEALAAGEGLPASPAAAPDGARPPSGTAWPAMAGTGRKLGETLGRNVAQADMTLRGVGQRIHELWQNVCCETKSAVESARNEYARHRPAPVVAPVGPASPVAPPRRRGFVGRVVTTPFRLVGWIFSNLLTVIATLVVAGALIGLTEIVLVSIIE
jgi:tRNA A-37 threonylcarbamoyl transferase component Bud32